MMQQYEPAPKLKSLDEYIAIGFDADLCIIKYELRELIRITYESISRSVYETFKYPAEALKFDPETDYQWVMNNLILDLQNGTVVKVGKEKQVLRAAYGLQMISDEQIKKIYGPDRKFDFDVMKSRAPGKYVVCTSFFESEIPCMFMKLVELKNRDARFSAKTYNEFYLEIHQGLLDNFLHYNDKTYKSIRDFGYYFPMVIAQNEKLFVKQTRMKKILEGLRAKGKLLFVNSNSHYEYLDQIFQYEFGKDWVNLFDAVVAMGMKPAFFMNKERKFREIDETQPNRLGAEISEPIPGKIVTGGNEELLYNYFKKLAKRDGRILFYGDNYITDCLASQANSHTDAVCIMEELDSANMICEDSKWGNYFKDTLDGKEVENYFVTLMNENIAFVASSCHDPALDAFYGL